LEGEPRASLPGKRRLDEATYKAVQAIYYPGFTLVGRVGELGGGPPSPWASSLRAMPST
jgi:hypothetical protein